MTPNYLEFHTIKSDEPKLLPPVKIQRNTKITKKKEKKKWQMCLEGGKTSRGRTCLEHPLQGTGDHIRAREALPDWKAIKQHALSILILVILRKAY